MTRNDLQTLFSEAWAMARAAQRKFGGRVRSFFAEALKQAYRMGPAKIRANALRVTLNVAARAAQVYGATEKQISFIVALAVKTNDFNIISGGRLTKREASLIIDQMLRDADRMAA